LKYNLHNIEIHPLKVYNLARQWWLMAAILATQEAEIRRIMVQRHTGQIISETLSLKYPSQKKDWWSGLR
jgi:hypothetical protein